MKTFRSFLHKEFLQQFLMATQHEFWNTQPVIQEGEKAPTAVGPLAPPRTVEEIPKDPLPLPSTFEWWIPDNRKSEDLDAVYELLKDNYVEDRSSTFRLNYSIDFLRWALTPPGYIPDWNVAVRRKSEKQLLGFISGVPIDMRMNAPASKDEPESEEVKQICQIDFLCVTKRLRVKKLAPLLIKEVTRRVNLCNIWQAIYTTGTCLPTPFSSGRYYHRTLNPEKAVGSGFSRLPIKLRNLKNPMKALTSILFLPDKPVTANLRPMQKKDIPQVTKLLNDFLKRYPVAPVFDEKNIKHLLIPREGVVYTYVVDGPTGLTDFFSFYSIPSMIIGNPKYSHLEVAYIFYYAYTVTPLLQLMNDLLIIAHSKHFDVCNLVAVMDNKTFTEELKFHEGDGSLQFHFYNWGYPPLPPSKVGLLML